MGIAERKEKQKLEIRKMILDASMKLFVEEGFNHVSIRKIAELIEYSPTTVYLYFKDKDEIFFNLHDIGFKMLLEANQNLGSIRNPLIRLHKMGENYLNFGMKNPEYYNLMFIAREPMKTLQNCDWENGDVALGLLKATIQECMDKGYLAKNDAHLVSLSVWSHVHGLVALAIRERMEKFVPQKEMLLRVMMESLNWLVNSIDISGKDRPAKTV
ncbi:MAG TPA: TetR/AcrR family transcriptional regulator [Puia sp.]|jgi:AcrR family transcriptional regulator